MSHEQYEALMTWLEQLAETQRQMLAQLQQLTATLSELTSNG